MTRVLCLRRALLTGALILAGGAAALAQVPLPLPPGLLQKISDHEYRIGRMRIDTAKRAITIDGHVNDAHVLEFVACTPGGFKAYESALTLETGAIPLNTALILIGLDKTHARVPTRHFDAVAPAGDPVEIALEWTDGGDVHREPIERLLLDLRTRQPIPVGRWVYTGSTFVEGGAYLADLDGVLIGFVHSPAPVIENPRAGAVDAYGSVVLNQALGLKPGAAVTVTIRAAAEPD